MLFDSSLPFVRHLDRSHTLLCRGSRNVHTIFGPFYNLLTNERRAFCLCFHNQPGFSFPNAAITYPKVCLNKRLPLFSETNSSLIKRQDNRNHKAHSPNNPLPRHLLPHRRRLSHYAQGTSQYKELRLFCFRKPPKTWPRSYSLQGLE